MTRRRRQYLAQKAAREAYPIAQKCEIAGCDKPGTRHHDDYDKPLEIKWLCHSHHAKEHIKSGSHSNRGLIRKR